MGNCVHMIIPTLRHMQTQSKIKKKSHRNFREWRKKSSQKPVLVRKEAGNKINIVILFIAKSYLFLTLHGLFFFIILIFFSFQEIKYWPRSENYQDTCLHCDKDLNTRALLSHCEYEEAEWEEVREEVDMILSWTSSVIKQKRFPIACLWTRYRERFFKMSK